MTHFLNLFEVSSDDILRLLKKAAQLKKAHLQGKDKPLLPGRVVAMIFEKPSLRTRVSFQSAVAQLGASSIFLAGAEAGMGTRETIPDFARTLSQYVDAVVLRTFSHKTIETFAQYCTKPVINGLSDCYHPCQALGDLLTMQELFGQISGRTMAFIGDGNNVAKSLAIGCGKLGVRFVLSSPDGYSFDKSFLEQFRRNVPEGDLEMNSDPKKAVAAADVIYTDVWTSMGQETETAQRKRKFARFQVNNELLAAAPRHAKIMHCLPAHRGEEITDDAMDCEGSVVFEQAGNRMHAQKALLVWLLT